MKFNSVILFFVFFVLFCYQPCYGSGLQIEELERNIDLSSHIIRHEVFLQIQNTGPQKEDTYVISFKKEKASKLAHLQVIEDDTSKILKITKNSDDKHVNYNVNLGSGIEGGSSKKYVAKMVFVGEFKPFPKKIKQNEHQKVIFKENAYFYTKYHVAKQKTIINVGTHRIESYTDINRNIDSRRLGSKLHYGKFYKRSPFEEKIIQVHFQHDKRLLRIVKLKREIEISHWGNLAIEEHYHIRHEGPQLETGFSRIDYQRGNPMHTAPSSFRTLTATLPSSANNIYFRDRIGNISSSTCKPYGDKLLVDFKPRFLLFGGWQTKFYIGYNLPIKNYLFVDRATGKHVLNTTFASPFHDTFIDELTVKVAVPEGGVNIQLYTPFKVDEESREILKTYLDSTGRPVVVMKKKNVVDEHNKYFQVTYSFSQVNLLREPLWVIASLFLFCSFIMIYVRLDFSISKGKSQLKYENESRVTELVEKFIFSVQTKRFDSYKSVESKIGGDGMDAEAFKKLDNERNELVKIVKDDILEPLKSLEASTERKLIAFIEKKELEKLDVLKKLSTKPKSTISKLEEKYDELTEEIEEALDELKQ